MKVVQWSLGDVGETFAGHVQLYRLETKVAAYRNHQRCN